MYDKCDACGKAIQGFEDTKLMQVESKIKAYCLSCFEMKTQKPEVKQV